MATNDNLLPPNKCGPFGSLKVKNLELLARMAHVMHHDHDHHHHQLKSEQPEAALFQLNSLAVLTLTVLVFYNKLVVCNMVVARHEGPEEFLKNCIGLLGPN